MEYQRRASQYLSSFMFGSGYNIDGFNISMNSDAFLSSLKIMVLFMTLPSTKEEWPWHDPDEKHNEQKKPDDSNTFDVRLGNAVTYFMNAVFVLMTTNYTLNPGLYFLGSTGTGGFMAYFPLIQVFLAVLYSTLKVYTSDWFLSYWMI